ncbi:MAG: orotate phosphoribosyltransferase, partial [Gaiellales bacterium]
MSLEDLGQRLLDRAYLEGDFLLRSGRRSRYYLDKYRFETEPSLLAGIGRELARMVGEHAPGVDLLAGPELGAVPLAAVT